MVIVTGGLSIVYFYDISCMTCMYNFSEDFIRDVYCTYQEIILWEIQRHPETRQSSE